jgi:hypothetical protein
MLLWTSLKVAALAQFPTLSLGMKLRPTYLNLKQDDTHLFVLSVMTLIPTKGQETSERRW